MFHNNAMAELEERISKLEEDNVKFKRKEAEKTGRWLPDAGETYWTARYDMMWRTPDLELWTNNTSDFDNFYSQTIFCTRKECEEYINGYDMARLRKRRNETF